MNNPQTYPCGDRVLWGRLIASCLVIASLGCDGNDGRVPATGVVLIDGEPLRHGIVRFYPEGSRSASGELDSEGRFTLNTKRDQSGIVPGTHAVKIDAREWVGPRSLRWHAPKKYASHMSGLEVTVEKGMPEIKIELTWDGRRPYVENLGGAPSESME